MQTLDKASAKTLNIQLKNYYNFNKIDSYNAFYNFLCGARGLGKTYGAKKKAIRAGIKRGEEFVYLRRYKTELAAARATFFTDIAHEFPEHDFRVNGKFAQYADIETRNDDKRVWKTIGYFIALSTSQNEKSVSFPNVFTIIFDEFIIEKGAISYLASEHIVFTNFYSTVDRYKDQVRVYFISNAVSIMNPYFIAYNIEPDAEVNGVTQEFVKKHKILVGPSAGKFFVVAHFPDSKDFANDVYKTAFGQFIANTEYADYAVGNTFDDNKRAMLELKDNKARYMFTLETKNGKFSVWLNIFSNKYYIQEKLPKSQEIYTLLSDKMDVDKTLLTFSDVPLQRLRSAFRIGDISFDKPGTRNTFAGIFTR